MAPLVRSSIWILAATLSAGVVSCGPPSQKGAQAGEEVSCPSGPRKARDCTSEVQYSGSKTEGSLSVASLGGGSAKHEEVALRRVDEETERFIATQNQLCRDYNSCALGVDDYNREAKEIRDRVSRIPALKEALKNAKSDAERTKIIDELYRGTVPDDKRTEEVTFRLGMEAKLPDSVGGGYVDVRPQMPLPTNARVAFTVNVSPQAFVYIFQKAPNGSLTTLFPDERIGTQNPLAGGQAARIPSGKMSFRLNEKDLGVENVYIAVSRKPLERLEQALARVSSGKVEKIGDDTMLQSFSALPQPAAGAAPQGCTRALELDAPAPPGGGCRKSRGLELDDGGGSPHTPGGGAPPTFAVRTEPGDDLIVKVFCFQHLSEQDYQAKLNQGTKPETKTRGGVILE